MAVTQWPSIADYSAAVQTPDELLNVSEISGARFATRPPLHLPVAASGANAVVFRADVSGRSAAVRCFTKDPGEERGRYIAFAGHVTSAQLDAISPPRWHDNAIFVGDEWRPVVVMDWISGAALHSYIEDRLHQPMALHDLASEWAALMAHLVSADIAHGDLQHGNVLVTPTGQLRLIDFDGVWIPAISTMQPSEWGHPNFQHPERGERGTWGRHIDWFAALVIDVSIRALAADPTLWDFHNEENLIFTSEDFLGSTPIWDRVLQSSDPIVRQRAKLLADSCGASAGLEVDLATLLEDGLPKTATASSGSNTSAASTSTSGAATGGTWWNPTGAGAAEPAPSTVPADPNARPSFEWSVDDTGRVVTPWAKSQGSRAATTPGERVGDAPPERRKASKQQVQSEWSDTQRIQVPSGGAPGSATPPPPTPAAATFGANPPAKTQWVDSSDWANQKNTGAAPAASNQPSFIWTLLVGAALITGAALGIEDPDARNIALAVIVGIVLIDLVNTLRRKGR